MDRPRWRGRRGVASASPQAAPRQAGEGERGAAAAPPGPAIEWWRRRPGDGVIDWVTTRVCRSAEATEHGRASGSDCSRACPAAGSAQRGELGGVAREPLRTEERLQQGVVAGHGSARRDWLFQPREFADHIEERLQGEPLSEFVTRGADHPAHRASGSGPPRRPAGAGDFPMPASPSRSPSLTPAPSFRGWRAIREAVRTARPSPVGP